MIYLDNNATTVVASEVFEAMKPYFLIDYGNPSSAFNLYGDKARKVIMEAKNLLADYFNANSENDIIFTSGATESNNLALRGLVNGINKKHCHIIVSSIEHKSVLEVCKVLESSQVSCTYLKVNNKGSISLDELELAIRDDTKLISVMGANNEIGNIFPIKQIGEIAHSHGILFHSDITQLVGEQRVNVNDLNLDLFSFSAHKIHGPKGVGCLYANRDARKMLSPLILGGNQQDGLRSGTLNVPGILGMSKAIELLNENIDIYNQKILHLRNLLLEKLQNSISLKVNGDMDNRLINNLNLTFDSISAVALASKIPDIAFSTGSSCLAGETSYVLNELGLTNEQAACTIRLGLSRYNHESEILYTAKRIIEAVNESIPW